MFENGSVAIFRLAPQDYHRFHSPIDGVVGDTTDIPGQYYTGMLPRLCRSACTERTFAVNPQAVNEPGFDVFTENKRSVLYMTHLQSGAPIAFVAIGAMLVRIRERAALPTLTTILPGRLYRVDERRQERPGRETRRRAGVLRVRREHDRRALPQGSDRVSLVLFFALRFR